MMKKLSRILTAALVAVLIVYAAVVTYVEESKPVLPPVRMAGEWILDGLPPMGFTELVKEADVIARVRIGDWLGVDSHFAVANFEAFPVEVYKGELPEKLVVAQFGNLEYRFYPWFTYGNEAFLFLDIPEDEYDHENTYRISDERTTAYIAYTDSGDAFIVPYNTDVFKHVPGADAYKVIPELRDWLVKNDPELWHDRPVRSAYELDRVAAVIDEVLTASSIEPPALSVSWDGETLVLEPREFSWTSQSGEYESPNATHPLELTDDEWNALPYLDGEPNEIEFLCYLEPSNTLLHGYHESYRRDENSEELISTHPIYINVREDGIFEIESGSGYVYVVSVSWNENEDSESPLYRGSAQYAFRVGETKEIKAEEVTLESFDEYPHEQLTNLLRGTPRAEFIERFGEPDIDGAAYLTWMRDDGRLLYVFFPGYPDKDGSSTIELTEGLRSPPPMLITIGGESYPVRRGTTSWRYCAYDDRYGGFEACSSAPEDWDWSETTIYTDATEAVITLDVSDRLAERMDVSIDGGLISAETVGETFELPGGSAKIYEFRVHVSDAAAEGPDSLFSGSSYCAVRIAPSGDKPQ